MSATLLDLGYEPDELATEVASRSSTDLESIEAVIAVAVVTECPEHRSGSGRSQASSSGMSRQQQNAIRAAENYLGFMAFPRKGLIDQLESEGHTTREATTAVDSPDVN